MTKAFVIKTEGVSDSTICAAVNALAAMGIEALPAEACVSDEEVKELRQEMGKMAMESAFLQAKTVHEYEEKLNLLRSQVKDFIEAMTVAKTFIREVKTNSREVGAVAGATEALNEIDDLLDQYKHPEPEVVGVVVTEAA